MWCVLYHQRRFAAALVTVTSLLLPAIGRAQSSPNAGSGPAALEPAADRDPIAVLGQLQERFSSIASQVAPSVVAISAPNAQGSDPIRPRKLSPDGLRLALDRTWRCVGSGFIIDSDGYIVTNEHVIGRAQQLYVTTDDRKVYPAVVIGSDPRVDVAVLKIPAHNLPVARFAPRSPVLRGQWTVALGNPFGLAVEGEMSMSVGVVSAVDRSLPELAQREDRLYVGLIQTSAQINPGNSGGPLLNLRGEVIGINTATIFLNGISNGVGFAIPLTPRLLDRINALKDGREATWGFLGVVTSTPTAAQRETAGLTDGIGAWIDYIEPGSPAASAGLKMGDIIVELDNQVVRSSEQLARLITMGPVDHSTSIAVQRGRSRTPLSVTLRRHAPVLAADHTPPRFRWRGLLIGPIPPNWDPADAPAQSGVMVLGIEQDSPLAGQGLAQGSIITSVAGKPVHDLNEFKQIVEKTPSDQCAIKAAPVAVTARHCGG